ncbi:hypothetical protein [Streptomyces acidiscabies]|uniref:hypothetical protein n=1 Tax=Streptomyces acidiscabies TaxID=42234 RepID=UPI003985C799
MDPTDLPGYAGRLHDCFTDHPDCFRLMSWGQLESGRALSHREHRAERGGAASSEPGACSRMPGGTRRSDR